MFLGAGRAALLQLAHPWVSASLAEHSNLMNDAIGRFHGTFRVVYTLVFGTRGQALAAARGLWRLHTGIRGIAPASGERYEANHVPALRWVLATLIESAVLAHEFALGPLDEAERERYYAESKRTAAMVGIPAAALPADWDGFARYCAETMEGELLQVDATARRLGESVMAGAGTWVRPPRWYRALTAGWLPPRLRAGFGLEFGPDEQARVERAARVLSRVYRRLPGALRLVGPAREAEARLRGRPPGPVVRASNRFWTGVERLPVG